MSNPRRSTCEICENDYWNTNPWLVQEHSNPRSLIHYLGKLTVNQRKELVGTGSQIEDDVLISYSGTSQSVSGGSSKCEKCGKTVKAQERLWCAIVGHRDGDYEYWCFDCLPEYGEKYDLESISKMIELIAELRDAEI